MKNIYFKTAEKFQEELSARGINSVTIQTGSGEHIGAFDRNNDEVLVLDETEFENAAYADRGE